MMPAMGDIVGYALALIAATLVLKRLLDTVIAKRKIPGLLKQGAVVIDVRSPAEFAAGRASGSRNIPLDDLEREAKHLDRGRWIIVCCASGARSAVARRWLRRHGFPQVLNAGSWRNVR
jgi:phage shock protein E